MPITSPFPEMHSQDLILFFVIAVLCVGGISLLPHLFTWLDNSQQPPQQVEAKVVAKRCDVHGQVNVQTGGQTSTTYYVTFEFGQHERREFSISGETYGMIAEGDVGTLLFQGTWYKHFERKT